MVLLGVLRLLNKNKTKTKKLNNKKQCKIFTLLFLLYILCFLLFSLSVIQKTIYLHRYSEMSLVTAPVAVWTDPSARQDGSGCKILL